MTQRTTSTSPDHDLQHRVRATLAQQGGRLDDIFTDDGHAPDAVDSDALGHCRVTVQATVADGRPVAA